jgi:hypothetical protein
MTLKRLVVLIGSAFVLSTLLVAFYSGGDDVVTTSAAATHPNGGEASPRFFGDLLARENDFFYQSILRIYEERYVPGKAGTGRFVLAQAGGYRVVRKRPSSNNGPAVQTPRTVPAATLITTLQGATKTSPDIDLSPNQRDTRPDVMTMVGPVSQDKDLRSLRYVPPKKEIEGRRLTPHPIDAAESSKFALQPDPIVAAGGPTAPAAMPAPSLTFPGVDSAASGCACFPPDTDGDVGPSHYIQSVNSSIKIFNKTGTALSGPTTYNSFFAALGPTTPCGTNNDGDGVVFYDHVADRWIVSDFAFTAFPGPGPFYQCIGVSKTSDPVAGGWWLYAIQTDPANPGFLGDYPKFGVWPDGYYMSVNMFSGLTQASEQFDGVRVYAFDRNAMINGTTGNVIAFTISAADAGLQYSLLPATYRLGTAPPAGQPEWLMDIDTPFDGTTALTSVYVRRFHADFVTPANSTFGVGATHAPDGTITVNPFVDAHTNTADSTIVPNGTGDSSQNLDTLGDKLMYPLVYQNLGGVESVWASHTVNNNLNGTGPTAIRWYQFNMTGNTIPGVPTQQQTFNNGGDGLWRWMPSLNVDKFGNMAVGYTVSSPTLFPQIRYAGRLSGDTASTLAQGEATLAVGTGTQTDTRGRWGDYTGCSFYHTNEYYTATSANSWNTRVGIFAFPACLGTSAAGVSVSGRVLAPGGAGLRNAAVYMRDMSGNVRTALTSAFGYYRFEAVEPGSYFMGVNSRKFTYQARIVSMNDSLTDVDFTP